MWLLLELIVPNKHLEDKEISEPNPNEAGCFIDQEWAK